MSADQAHIAALQQALAHAGLEARVVTNGRGTTLLEVTTPHDLQGIAVFWEPDGYVFAYGPSGSFTYAGATVPEVAQRILAEATT